jgi:hypothetical protein
MHWVGSVVAGVLEVFSLARLDRQILDGRQQILPLLSPEQWLLSAPLHVSIIYISNPAWSHME